MDAGAWSVRIYYKPFIRWIWLGGLFMVLGGFLGATDRRYRLAPRQQEAWSAVSASETAR
jgi:cytochrome c-type biogenesis protein CcmF